MNLLHCTAMNAPFFDVWFIMAVVAWVYKHVIFFLFISRSGHTFRNLPIERSKKASKISEAVLQINDMRKKFCIIGFFYSNHFMPLYMKC